MDFNTIFKKLKKYFLSLNKGYIITGVFWIFLFFYIRFFITRPTYTLANIKPYITNLHLLGYITFILFHVILIGIVIYSLFKFQKQSLITYKISVFFLIRYFGSLYYIYVI